MKSFLALVALAAFVSTGCARQDPPAAQAVQSPAETPGTLPDNRPVDASTSVPGAHAKPATRAAAPLKAAEAKNAVPLEGLVHVFMTTQLRKFIQETGRLPTDFSEFSSARLDSVPFPPDGMKYAIDYATLEVKAVKN
jgi:hypothetical protein